MTASHKRNYQIRVTRRLEQLLTIVILLLIFSNAYCMEIKRSRYLSSVYSHGLMNFMPNIFDNFTRRLLPHHPRRFSRFQFSSSYRPLSWLEPAIRRHTVGIARMVIRLASRQHLFIYLSARPGICKFPFLFFLIRFVTSMASTCFDSIIPEENKTKVGSRADNRLGYQ